MPNFNYKLKIEIITNGFTKFLRMPQNPKTPIPLYFQNNCHSYILTVSKLVWVYPPAVLLASVNLNLPYGLLSIMDTSIIVNGLNGKYSVSDSLGDY